MPAQQENRESLLSPVPILVIGIGNPSRGDDALGRMPLMVEVLDADGALVDRLVRRAG